MTVGFDCGQVLVLHTNTCQCIMRPTVGVDAHIHLRTVAKLGKKTSAKSVASRPGEDYPFPLSWTM